MTSSQPPRGAHTKGWRIGTIGGAPVIVTAGWLLVAAVLVIVVGSWLRDRLLLGPSAFAWAAIVPALLFVCVFVHECAHGLAARWRGIPAHEYVITLWGGHTSFDRDLAKPADSAIISVAGPISNLVLAGLGWIALGMLDSFAGLAALAFVYTNLVVAIFNLLPALPMDGGKLLEAAVWAVAKDKLRGTLVAGRAGQILAVVVAVVALGEPLLRGYRPDLTTAIWALVIAGVIFSGAAASVRYAKAQLSVRGVDVLAMATPAIAVDGAANVASATAAAQGAPGHAIVLVAASRPVAVISPAALASVPPQLRDSTPVSAVATPIGRLGMLRSWRGPDAVSHVAQAARAGEGILVLVDSETTPVAVVTVAEVVRLLGQRNRR